MRDLGDFFPILIINIMTGYVKVSWIIFFLSHRIVGPKWCIFSEHFPKTHGITNFCPPNLNLNNQLNKQNIFWKIIPELISSSFSSLLDLFLLVPLFTGVLILTVFSLGFGVFPPCFLEPSETFDLLSPVLFQTLSSLWTQSQFRLTWA